MKKHTDPLFCDAFYHIYNRGINGEDLFREERNYSFFLTKYAKYTTTVVDTYAYCLLKNHFHFLVKTKSADEILKNVDRVNVGRVNVGRVPNPADVNTEREKRASAIISRQFGNLFNCYAQAVNKTYERTGGLFEEPFRRVQARDIPHCMYLVYYINTNAQKHDFVDDFRDWPHSSFGTFFSNGKTQLCRAEVLGWFGGTAPFLAYHLERESEKRDDFRKLEIED